MDTITILSISYQKFVDNDIEEKVAAENFDVTVWIIHAGHIYCVVNLKIYNYPAFNGMQCIT